MNKEEVVDPWTVEGAVVDGQNQAIDYQRLLDKFGTQPIKQELLDRIEKATNKKVHRFLRRGIFFSHRDLELILTKYEKGEPFYLYTGRGPSSKSMHMGHFVPFIFCQWMQETFKVPVVIQLTDDEKFFFKSLELEQCIEYGLENSLDILACGFDPKLTYIFSNSLSMNSAFYSNICRIGKHITLSTSKSSFGFQDSDSVSKAHFVCVQAAPSFCSTFPHIFGSRKDISCLIPCAIDQDPYFRLTRDVALKIGCIKPSVIHSQFFPALQGLNTKMSASIQTSAIYSTDTKAQIKQKINKYAFSGGKDTLEEHRLKGGNPDIDISFQYLCFFLESDEELEKIRQEYISGKLLSGELKKICIQVITEFMQDFQEKRSKISRKDVLECMSTKPMEWK